MLHKRNLKVITKIQNRVNIKIKFIKKNNRERRDLTPVDDNFSLFSN